MSEPLTPEREAEIRNRRLDEVTAGPWLVTDDQDGCPVIYVEQTTPEGTVYGSVLLTADWASEADVQFVCSARESVPQLLAELDRARAELRDVQREAVEAERSKIRDGLLAQIHEISDGWFRWRRNAAKATALHDELDACEARWAAEDADAAGRAE